MDKQKVGSRIQKARQLRGFTQAELAEKAALTPKYVSNIECGFKTPKLETFVTIANALQVDANTLLMDVLDSSLETVGIPISNKFHSLPPDKQRKLLRLFDIMIDDANE